MPKTFVPFAMPMTTVTTKMISSAPRFCSWPAARRTSRQARSTRLAIASVMNSVATIPQKATKMPALTLPVR